MCSSVDEFAAKYHSGNSLRVRDIAEGISVQDQEVSRFARLNRTVLVELPMNSAGLIVAAWMAASGVSPDCTSNANSRCSSGPASERGPSVPAMIFTPARHMAATT